MSHPSGSTIPAGNLLIVSGPSGSGKTSLCRIVLRDLTRVRFSISHTTRPARQNEQDGQDYHFISEADFKSMIRRDEFLEWARVYGNYYGTGARYVEETLQQGHDVLLDIDVQGARLVKKRVPEALAVLVFPPSYSRLRDRLRGRALDSEEVIQERLEIARMELQSFEEYDYLIINDELERAAGQLKSVLVAGRCRRVRQEAAAMRILSTFHAPHEPMSAGEAHKETDASRSRK